ncbi:sulfur oxidation c-type cytochrome SoxX [Azohydromonas australica]|uniref:sulfur oxidation c-type cytochrome SoxX n=1 Tax=Azohydromonas australica TaxID=364039 RepID=UPI0005BC6A02|nr:sulfur oxidation c-type cytochrome SoxX [Azohydromonas australica]
MPLAAAVAGWLAATAAAHAEQPPSGIAKYRVVGDGIPRPLTTVQGDARRGRAITATSAQGNCTICHHLPMPEVPVFGNIGPALDGVGSRLTEAQLRLRIVDARRLNPDGIMPAYYKVHGLHRVAARYVNRPMLQAQEVEDVVAYLMTLR